MVSKPNDTILRTEFVIPVHQFWVLRKMTSSSQTSGRPNFVRKSDGWARVVSIRPSMFRFSTRTGTASTHFCPSSSILNLWGWVMFHIYTFRENDILLVTQLYVALIRGPRAGRLFMSGESIHPQTETMAGIHNIRNITPGAIATCAILVHYCHLYCQFSISNSLSGSLGTFSRWHSSGSRLEYRNTLLQRLRRVPHDSWDRATTKEEEYL